MKEQLIERDTAVLAKEKAKELIEKFSESITNFEGDGFIIQDPYIEKETARLIGKQLALISCDEIIKEHCKNSEYKNPIKQDDWINYWHEVKQHLNNG